MSSVHELTLAIHDAAGIPWWATIIAVSAIPRILLVPVVAYQNRVSMLSALLAPKLNEIQNSLSRDSGGSSKEMMKKYRKATEEISSKYGYSLSMTLASLGASVIQIPISVTLFFAMLSQELAWKFPGITEGGAYWFTDLTKPDPTMIFPIISSISMISTIYVNLVLTLQVCAFLKSHVFVKHAFSSSPFLIQQAHEW